MNLNLKNKRVIISGATRGIGFEIANQFLEEGAKVVILSRSKEKLEDIKLKLFELYSEDKILGIECDVTSELAVKSTIDATTAKWGGVDIVIANVGDGRSVPEPMPDKDQFSFSWKSNFESAEILVRGSLFELIKTSGNIVFISSIAGLESFGAPTDYSVAKSGIIALSKNLARKLAPDVRVNCIAPGNVIFPGGNWDEKLQKNPKGIQELINISVPVKRFGKPEEIASAVVFLASEKATFITGACLVIDGGQTVGFH